MTANGRPVAFYQYGGNDYTTEKLWPNCGTYAGWNSHRRSQETPCDACKAAFRDYTRAYRRAGRDKQLSGCTGGLGWPRAGTRWISLESLNHLMTHPAQEGTR
jgi:hypothetical protein